MKRKNLIDGRIDGRLFLAGNGAADHPKDVAGDKEYNRVCREYELKGGGQHGAVTGLFGQIS